ncbi:MAG TPA: serine hydrolase domain-containing protein [Kofleriaceae bacterium]
MTKVHGTVAPGFERVRDEFARNFSHRKELGAACAVEVGGKRVVDLWGGVRDATTRAPWTEDTMVLVFSTTKGMAAIALAVAHSRGLFEWDQPVAKYWPEFAQQGKGAITVRQLVSHQAGLCGVDEPFDANKLADLDLVAKALAAQAPAWEPGTRHGYHAISIGWYLGELVRRVDPKRRSLGRFFHDEVATPLSIDFYIGLPDSVPRERVASIEMRSRLSLLLHLNTLPWRFVRDIMKPKTLTARSFNNPRVRGSATLDTPAYRAVEMPASNGIGSARAIARAYGALATGGRELGIQQATLGALMKPPTRPRDGSYDLVLHVDTAFSCGFLKPCGVCKFGSSGTAFGTQGAGGSFGFADPDIGLGFAYVMNRMGFHVADDPREKALRDATYACLAATRRRSA